MAKVLFGVLASEIRAKVGGVVYSRVRGTAVVRTKVTPHNPRTNLQQFVRGNFSALGKAWSQTLTERERQQWITFAAAFSVRDKLGQTIFLTGHMWYTRTNAMLMFAGNPVLSVPPAAPLVDQIVSITLTGNSISASNLTVTFDRAAGAANEIFFFGTKPLSPGRNNFKPFLRLFHNVQGSSLTSYNVFADYVSSFGTPITGKAAGIGAYWQNIATGTLSVQLVEKLIWAA